MKREEDPADVGSTATITETGAALPAVVSAPERGTTFGRYLMLERLGAGGVGVVYSAYDPDLDRKVAVKILHREAVRDQSRLRREARALARVQHPNVIAVYDVGLFEDRSFVAMELVTGMTLAQWLDEAPRPWREVVDVLLQAGRGLAAAHAVGLVHRDFKPANVLVGRDGRVRVVDFGLARSVDGSDGVEDLPPSTPRSPILQESITRTGSLLGTPRYMAPEQFLGLPADAKSDQFSFGVALYQGLFGERPFSGDDLATISAAVTGGQLNAPPKDAPVPLWVRNVALRGLATNAEQRWPSMEALLAALSRDPVRARRRWMLGGGAVVALSLLGLGVRGMQRHDALVCRGAERKLAGVWDEERKSAMHASFVATGEPAAEAAFRTVTRALDGFAHGWVAMHTEACEATRLRRVQSEEVLDLRMECLGQRLQEAKAQVDLLTSADGAVVNRAVRLASSLPGLSDCSDVAALQTPVRPPRDPATRARVSDLRAKVARVQALHWAGKRKEALALAQPLADESRALGYRPLEAVALTALGTVQRMLGHLDEASKNLEEAVVAASAGRDAAAEVNASAALAHVALEQAHYAQAHAFGRRGFAANEALGGSNDRPLSYLLYVVAQVFSNEGKFTEALEYHRRSLAIREKAFGPESLNVAASLDQVARVLLEQGRYAEAEQVALRAISIYAKQVGPDDGESADARTLLARALAGQGRYPEALALYRRALAAEEKALGPEHQHLVFALNNIANILTKQGQYDEALATHRRSLAITEKASGPSHPYAAFALTNIGDILRLQGKGDQAITLYRRAIAIWEKAVGPTNFVLAFPLTGIGRVELDRHQAARALPPLERAISLFDEGQGGDAADRADTAFALARALWQSGRDHARAQALATRARAGYASAGAKSKDDLATIDAWLADPR